MTLYELARDRYLAHVETCPACRRVWVDYWDAETHKQIQYWSVWQPCPARTDLLRTIDSYL